MCCVRNFVGFKEKNEKKTEIKMNISKNGLGTLYKVDETHHC